MVTRARASPNARVIPRIIPDRRPVCFVPGVRAFFFSILGYFLTPAGIVFMGILDASMVFFLPLGIDFVVIVMTAGGRDALSAPQPGLPSKTLPGHSTYDERGTTS